VLVDGDHILAILAMAMDRNGDLVESTVVATVMANLGFKNAMRTAGITVVETGVGDRYVLEAMRDGGFVLGGEQSGHVVMSSHATTGDGILTGLHLLAEVARSGQPLSVLAASVTKLPQVLINVRGVDRAGIPGSPTLLAAVAAAEAGLGDTGRVLLRPSGTEPVIRVMVEAATEADAARISEELAAVVRAELAID
jgi:phosphoglucosamine mutase